MVKSIVLGPLNKLDVLSGNFSVAVVVGAPNLEASSASNSLANDAELLVVLVLGLGLMLLLKGVGLGATVVAGVVIKSSQTLREGSVVGLLFAGDFCFRRTENSSSVSRSMSKSKEGTSKAGRLGRLLEASLVVDTEDGGEAKVDREGEDKEEVCREDAEVEEKVLAEEVATFVNSAGAVVAKADVPAVWMWWSKA